MPDGRRRSRLVSSAACWGGCYSGTLNAAFICWFLEVLGAALMGFLSKVHKAFISSACKRYLKLQLGVGLAARAGH